MTLLDQLLAVLNNIGMIMQPANRRDMSNIYFQNIR
jgi:hypothetical protein